MSKKEIKISNETLNIQKDFANKVFELNQQYYEKNAKQRLAFVVSYGCQQNVSDGEKIKGILATMGYGFTDDFYEADFALYNTCAIRENAEDRVFGNVGELKHAKEQNRDMLVGLCGCMMQQEHIVSKIRKSYPHVDIVFGTHVIHELPQIIYNALTTGKKVISVDDSDGIIAEDLPVRRDESIKASVPIIYGCNNFCTYCIVPFVRGRERSRESESILKEVRELVANGYKEITLLGQNVNSYGKGLDEDINFAKLLEKVNAIEGDFRIRFMTSHPKDATRELIDTIAKCEKVCKHIHLPIQSGSDRILKLMNRHYDRQHYMNLVNYAKETLPELSFTTDIIIGFPGETREDFLQTADIVKTVEYDSMFTFIYSKRVGTKAASMDDPTPEADKGAWFTELLQIQKGIGNKKYKGYIGKTVRILVDGIGKTSPEFITGRTDNYVIVDFKGDKDLFGKFVKVKVTASLNWALQGEFVCIDE